MPRFACSALMAALAAAPLGAQLTRPERSGYRETSRYQDVVAFLDALPSSPRMHRTIMGYTMEGRALPLVVWGAVGDASPAAVRGSGKTIVYLQGNIHAGEVEGKEALQELLRALSRGEHASWADSLVLLIAPIYNADGNERVTLTNRPHQLGPIGGMGQRPNAQGLDLNRDYTKIEAPETRSTLELIRAYDPHVLVDLHTTNGTFHAYHLTYAPPLHPNTDAAITRLLRDQWLPAVTRAVRGDGLDFYYYGNVPQAESMWAAEEGSERGWYTYDHRPRFGVNYAGLRNRFGILSEAYAYLPFEDRIRATRRFVEEVLSWAHGHAAQIRRTTAEADARMLAGSTLATRARLQRAPEPVEIHMGAVDTLVHPYTGEIMLRRREVSRAERMPEYGTFSATATEVVPEAWLVPASLAERLAAHGVRMERLASAQRMRVEEFRVDSTRTAAQAFQGHSERRVWGHWIAAEREVPAGTLRVSARQPLGRLAFTLLEPNSDDGFADWNVLDEALRQTPAAYPILRVPGGR
jgi:hypothetical protein